jgi:hypothetical protein
MLIHGTKYQQCSSFVLGLGVLKLFITLNSYDWLRGHSISMVHQSSSMVCDPLIILHSRTIVDCILAIKHPKVLHPLWNKDLVFQLRSDIWPWRKYNHATFTSKLHYYKNLGSKSLKFLVTFLPNFVVLDKNQNMRIWGSNHRIFELPYWTLA